MDVALLGDSALGIICQSENVPPLLLFYRTEGRQISLPAADDGDAAKSFFRRRRSSKVKGGRVRRQGRQAAIRGRIMKLNR